MSQLQAIIASYGPYAFGLVSVVVLWRSCFRQLAQLLREVTREQATTASVNNETARMLSQSSQTLLAAAKEAAICTTNAKEIVIATIRNEKA